MCFIIIEHGFHLRKLNILKYHIDIYAIYRVDNEASMLKTSICIIIQDSLDSTQRRL